MHQERERASTRRELFATGSATFSLETKSCGVDCFGKKEAYVGTKFVASTCRQESNKDKHKLIIINIIIIIIINTFKIMDILSICSL
jgi:hypothetical protein